MAYDPVVASVTLTGSMLSLVASACVLTSFAVYHKEQRSFRHALVFNLTLAEFINSLDNSVSGIIYMRDHQLLPGAACTINGFLGQVSVQAVDFSILAIAIVTLLTVTRTTFMPAVSRVTKVAVCASVWVMPLTSGITATAMKTMVPVGTNWCWITSERPDLRYALTHGWRFAVIFGTVAIYLYIWYYLRNHFRSMGEAIKTGWSQLSADGQEQNELADEKPALAQKSSSDGKGAEKDAQFQRKEMEEMRREDSVVQGQLTVPKEAAKRSSHSGFGMSFYNDSRSSVNEYEEDNEELLTPIERERIADEERAKKQYKSPRLQAPASQGDEANRVSWNLPQIPNWPLSSNNSTPTKIRFAGAGDSPQQSPRTVPGGQPDHSIDAVVADAAAATTPPRPARTHKRSVSEAGGAIAPARGPAHAHKRTVSGSGMAAEDSGRTSIGSTYSIFPNAKASGVRRSVPAEGFGLSATEAAATPRQSIFAARTQQRRQSQPERDQRTMKEALEQAAKEWPPSPPWRLRSQANRRTTNISEFPIRRETRQVDREVQRMLLLNAYPILYVILWVPGLINRLMEAAGYPLTGRAAQALQSSSQYIGLANALTYGFNRHIRHRIKGDLISKLRPGDAREIIRN